MNKELIVTYDKDGKSHITTFNHGSETWEQIRKSLHKRDVREQIGEYVRDTVKDLYKPTVNIGYDIEVMPKFTSRISNIQFHPGKTLNNFNVEFPYESTDAK